MGNGWIGVDLDGTLAEYDEWVHHTHIGDPIPIMRDRVLHWLKEGKQVKIFTARVWCGEADDPTESAEAREAIEEWCIKHLGYKLPVTNEKDYGMYELWDDRAVTVQKNTGKIIMHPKGETTP